jgi:hypothetical protein
MQALLPVAGWYLPVGQFVQTDWPATAANVPTGQTVQNVLGCNC